MEKQKHIVSPKSLLIRVTILILLVGFGHCSVPKNEVQDYEIAPPVYTALAEKSLDYLSNFEFDSFASMLAEDVEYELPDGKKIVGKTALVHYWQHYKNTSGITSMSIVNANYLPIDAHVKPKGDQQSGVKVLVDFTNNMIIKDKKMGIKMNFSIHFNKAKLIDRMSVNYDSSKITSTF
jgi:hypothetical protein